MFERPHHQAIEAALRSLNYDLFRQAECWFGGGTAIVLELGEYRESVDIDFLCASQDGYRTLRSLTFGGHFDPLTKPGTSIRALRELRADQYGLRTQIAVGETAIKFEIVRESRVPLAGREHPQLGVPTLLREDMYCEKLLANADRFNDSAVLSRDILDLTLMISRWGPIPEVAWAKARTAYGESVDAAYTKAVSHIRKQSWLQRCMSGMSMDPVLEEEILAVHGGPLEPDEDRLGL